MLEPTNWSDTVPQDPKTAAQLPEQRASRRWKVLEEAEILSKSGRIACEVQDISAIGANISLKMPLPVAEDVSLILIGFGAVPAEVAWSDGHCAGLKFTYDETHRGVMADWLMLIVDM